MEEGVKCRVKGLTVFDAVHAGPMSEGGVPTEMRQGLCYIQVS